MKQRYNEFNSKELKFRCALKLHGYAIDFCENDDHENDDHENDDHEQDVYFELIPKADHRNLRAKSPRTLHLREIKTISER